MIVIKLAQYFVAVLWLCCELPARRLKKGERGAGALFSTEAKQRLPNKTEYSLKAANPNSQSKPFFGDNLGAWELQNLLRLAFLFLERIAIFESHRNVQKSFLRAVANPFSHHFKTKALKSSCRAGLGGVPETPACQKMPVASQKICVNPDWSIASWRQSHMTSRGNFKQTTTLMLNVTSHVEWT